MYWLLYFLCKTPGCNTAFVVKAIKAKTESGADIITDPPPDDFAIDCNRCGVRHPYYASDVQSRLEEEIPPDFQDVF